MLVGRQRRVGKRGRLREVSTLGLAYSIGEIDVEKLIRGRAFTVSYNLSVNRKTVT